MIANAIFHTRQTMYLINEYSKQQQMFQQADDANYLAQFNILELKLSVFTPDLFIYDQMEKALYNQEDYKE